MNRHRQRMVPLLLMVLMIVAGCHGGKTEGTYVVVTGGNPRRGAHLIRSYGCGACHSIPGIQRAQSRVGPPLEDLKERVYIAGVIANTPQNLMRWIEHPRAVDPRSAMPEMGVTPDDARDIAAYLYSR